MELYNGNNRGSVFLWKSHQPLCLNFKLLFVVDETLPISLYHVVFTSTKSHYLGSPFSLTVCQMISLKIHVLITNHQLLTRESIQPMKHC